MTSERDDLPRLQRSSLSETVYRALSDALLKGKFKPGDRLRIRDLAGQLDTSVTPVRDAILRLHHDGAVVFESARNIQVVRLSSESYQQIREIRLELESLSARKAAALATPADIRRAEAMLAENEEAIRAGDASRGAELNQQFHFLLFEIAGLPILESVVRPLWMRTGPLIAQGYLAGGRKMIDRHYDVVDALRAHNPDDAVAAIRRDLLEGGTALIDILEQGAQGESADAAPAGPEMP